MNYKKIYNDIMIRSKNRVIDGYTEKHHIIPKCIGGTNHKSNIAILTPSEHFIAHQLLVKIYPDNGKIIYAARCMATMSNNGSRVNNKLFGWIREKYSREISKKFSGVKFSEERLNAMSNLMKSRNLTKERNPFYGKTHTPEVREKIKKARTGIKLSDEHKKKISIHMTGIVHTEQCRKLISEKLKNNPKVECPHCGKIGAKSPMIRHHFDNCKLKGLN